MARTPVILPSAVPTPTQLPSVSSNAPDNAPSPLDWPKAIGFVPHQGLVDIQALRTFSYAGPTGVIVFYRGSSTQISNQTAQELLALGYIQLL